MTDHLPECPLLEPCDDEVAEHGYCSMQNGVFCIHCQQWCICDRLRACEQRVEETWSAIAGRDQYAEGYRAGLAAAREAILHDESCLSNLDDADDRDCDCTRPSAVAAIDALREKP